MKNNLKYCFSVSRRTGQIVRIMLLTHIVIFLCFFTSLASGVSQNRVENLVLEKTNLSVALKNLAEVGKCKFIFNYDDLNGYEVSASLKNKTVEECLEVLLSGKPFKYTVQDEFIVISYKEQTLNPARYIVKGQVTEKNGTPLPGVAIMIKASNAGMASDVDGNFQLPVAEKNTALVFSFVGMKTREIVTNGNEPLHVVMESETTELGEVVATGFQTISRERSTGSAVILNKEKLDIVQAPNLTEKVEGLVPGLLNYGGNMSIRGTSSFAVSSTPLLVVDGQVMNVSLSAINPEDIESLTVLKDAAATSLYGVRASNGVIVITTRKAKEGKMSVNASAGFYINPLPDMNYLDYASTSDIIDFEKEFLLSDPTYKSNPAGYFANKIDLSKPGHMTPLESLYYEMSQGNLTQEQVDSRIEGMRKNDYRQEARDALERTALTQDYNLSVNKGGERSDLFFSLRYENFGKYARSASSDRLSLYFKNEMDLTRWFKFTYGMNSYFTRDKSSQSNAGWLQAKPYERLTDDAGNPVYQYDFNYYLAQKVNETEGLNFMGYNALEEADKNMQDSKGLYLKFFAHSDFKLLKGLDLGLKFQYERNNSDSKQYDEADSYYMRRLINNFASTNAYGGFDYHIPEGGHLKQGHNRSEFLNFRAQANYSTTIREKHDLTLLAGGEIREDKWYGSKSEIYGYDDQRLTNKQVDWLTLSQYGVIGQLNSKNVQSLSELLDVSETTHRYVSAYANAGYTYDSRYTLNGSVRVEQADLFGSDPKYRYRPLWSLGASWNVTRENFMEGVKLLDMLKLRITYGITGNVDQTSSPYLLGAYLNSPYTNANLTDIIYAPNKMLRWEKTSTFNVGADVAMFGRLNASMDIYRRYSSDLLANKTLDPSLGFPNARMNNGAMKNVGVEFSISYDWLKQKDWSLNTLLTAAYNKNKIEEVGFMPSNAVDMLRAPGSNYLKGDIYNSLYAYRYAGLTDAGLPSVYDEKDEIRANEPVRNIGALVNAGQLTPKWNGALSIALRWKTMEFFTRFVYYTGHSLRNDVTPIYSLYSDISGAMHEDMVRRWTPENRNTDIPAMGNHGLVQDQGLHWKYADAQVLSASFIKLRNIGLSYSLPKDLIRNMKLDQVSVRAQVNNPFYWAANQEGIDPEAFDANSGSRYQAQATTYVLGLNINF